MSTDGRRAPYGLLLLVVVVLVIGGLIRSGVVRLPGVSVCGAPQVSVQLAKDTQPVSLGDLKNGFSSVIGPVLPAVVNISSTKMTKVQPNTPGIMNDPLFREFFGDQAAPPSASPQMERQYSLGSGVIVNSDGYILTNNHVIDGTSDVVLSSLPNDESVRSVYTGPQGVLDHIRTGSLIIEMSTVSPDTSRELHRLGSERGVSVLDVPVSGSTPAAEQGLLTLLCGGDEPSFDAAEAIFTAIGRQYFYLGPSGSGNTMKLVVNTLLGVGMQAIAEAVVFGEKSGLDRQRLLDVLSKTSLIAPAHLGKLTKAKEYDYRPEFAIGLMNKDFRLILETALAVRAPMPTTAAAFPINNAEFVGHPDYDFSAVIDRMEELASVNSAKQRADREAIRLAN